MHVSREADAVAISVADSGIGIRPELRSRVFEMFVQVDDGDQPGHGGLGIGLTLVRSIVEMHGGTVTVQSAGTNKGSEFIVRLPLPATALASPVPVDAPGADAVRAKRRVMIVDDREDAARMLGLVVAQAGHKVQLAFSGEEALALGATFRPEVVLLDLGMPKMDGYEVARRLRRRAWGKKLMLVAVSGWGQDEDQRRTREAGFDRHLVKPVDLDALGELLAAGPPVAV